MSWRFAWHVGDPGRFILLAAAVVVVTAGSAGATPATGLVSYWSFEGNTEDRASDYTNNSGLVEDDLSPRGGTATFVPGAVGQAAQIGVSAGDPTDLTALLSVDVQLPATYTIEMWILPTELSDTWQRLMLNWGGSDFAYHFAIRNNSGFTNAVSLFQSQSDGAQPNANGGTVLLDEWNHVAGVADGTNLNVYLNGAPVGQTPYDGTILVSTSEGLSLGDSASAVSSLTFNGLLDEVAVWDVALDASEIHSHFLAGADGYGLTPVPEPGTAALLGAATALLLLRRRHPLGIF